MPMAPKAPMRESRMISSARSRAAAAAQAVADIGKPVLVQRAGQQQTGRQRKSRRDAARPNQGGEPPDAGHQSTDAGAQQRPIGGRAAFVLGLTRIQGR